MPNITDRIEKQIVLRAPRHRVWRAIADTADFGRWFGVQLDGPWVVGQPIRGRFQHLPTQAQIDAATSKLGLAPAPIRAVDNEVFATVVALDAERRLAFRWIPYGIDAAVEPASEPTTLVEFVLDDDSADAGSTRLTITESGFDGVPEHRRARAFLMNDGGWTAQADNLAKHVSS